MPADCRHPPGGVINEADATGAPETVWSQHLFSAALISSSHAACQDVGIVAQWRADRLLEQGPGFVCLAGIQQRHAQANAVLHGGRARKFGASVAKVLTRLNQLLGRANGLAGAARVAGFREVDREEVDDTAEQRKREEQDESVEALARANGAHREVDGCQYMESDSDIGHVCRLVRVRVGTIVGVGSGAIGGGLA